MNRGKLNKKTLYKDRNLSSIIEVEEGKIKLENSIEDN
jgi:hypothetical protein